MLTEGIPRGREPGRNWRDDRKPAGVDCRPRQRTEEPHAGRQCAEPTSTTVPDARPMGRARPAAARARQRKPLAQHVADRGYRVLITTAAIAASPIVIGGEVGIRGLGRRSPRAAVAERTAGHRRRRLVGCRLGPVPAHHPQAVRAAVLARHRRAFAAQRLTENYYGKYIRAAQEGGMAAGCDLEHFGAHRGARPANRATLMAMDPKTSSPPWNAGASSSPRAPSIR